MIIPQTILKSFIYSRLSPWWKLFKHAKASFNCTCVTADRVLPQLDIVPIWLTLWKRQRNPITTTYSNGKQRKPCQEPQQSEVRSPTHITQMCYNGWNLCMDTCHAFMHFLVTYLGLNCWLICKQQMAVVRR